MREHIKRRICAKLAAYLVADRKFFMALEKSPMPM